MILPAQLEKELVPILLLLLMLLLLLPLPLLTGITTAVGSCGAVDRGSKSRKNCKGNQHAKQGKKNNPAKRETALDSE
ncbi:hypothetical protein GQ42DRAFT_43522 [Ramicandelaber brevisporus]|nr:hypothetical protein GQ42DRAFT_43522 [Ramicandelaber brevisporus]